VRGAVQAAAAATNHIVIQGFFIAARPRGSTNRKSIKDVTMRNSIIAGCAAATLVFAAPLASSFAETDAASPDQQEHSEQSREQRRQQWATVFDARLVGFKASLALASDQEKNWPAFEAALRSFAQSPGQWKHHDGAKTDGDAAPSPVDVMRRMSQRMGQRSAQLTALADATTPLYTTLDDNQKLIFRATLRQMWRAHRYEHERRRGQ
jgi:zinc resistance-associated protein